ncbi:MAG: MerR family transcriptional regulator [Intestinibacter sp.]|uniref:MerR family transcriptional regulator n=1 Tax=Intestinibacter sp. TaxID=1965304 RepID=UPI003F17AEB2
MKEFFTIGEISKLFNINKKTLRYYDEIDLFKPSYVDKNNKYRYYSIDQFECLETIQYMKELGLTLNKIKYHLNDLNLNSIIDSLEYQNQIIEEKISELKNMQMSINKKISQIKDATQRDILNQIRELDFEQRCVIEYREKISYKDVELLVRKLAQVSSYKVSLTYGDVGISVSKENLEKQLYEEYDSAFMMVEEGLYEKELIKIFPKAKYLSIRYNGYHEDAPKYYKKLRKYIDENNYEIIDDSIEIQLVDPSLITCESEMVTEIQIPVRRKEND